MSASKANISSVDALRHFHLQTINFNEETQQALTRLQIELKHACRYVEFELPAKLKSEHEKWLKILNQSKQEVRQPSKQKSSSEAQQIQRQASVRVRELEERLEKAKQWKQRLASLIDQPESTILKLKTFLLQDMDKAALLLKSHADTLDDYIQGTKQPWISNLVSNNY